jgi:hypothetical protein
VGIDVASATCVVGILVVGTCVPSRRMGGKHRFVACACQQLRRLITACHILLIAGTTKLQQHLFGIGLRKQLCMSYDMLFELGGG